MSSEHTTFLSSRGRLFSSLRRNFWIPLVVFLTAGQMAVVFSLGTRKAWPPPLLVFGDLLFNLSCLLLVVEGSPQSLSISRAIFGTLQLSPFHFFVSR